MPIDSCRELIQRIDPDEVARVCSDLVRINTANPPGGERPAAEYVARYLGDSGFERQILDYPGEPERASALCRLRAGNKGNARTGSLLFSGHLDVVPPGLVPWQRNPFGGEIAEGQVWGRGAADMKGGVAALLVAAKTLARVQEELRGDLLVAATAGEEVGMQGAVQVAGWPELGPLGAAIIAEPTANTLGLAERGILSIEFTTYGKTAHGSTPRLGRNAINMMRRLLDELDRTQIPFTRHPVLGEPTYSINTIEGGVVHNVVPDRCVAVIDMRTVPGQDHADIMRQMEEMIARLKTTDAGADADGGFDGMVRAVFDLTSVDPPPDHPAVAAFLSAIESVTGRRPAPGVVRFATEAAIYTPRLGVTALIFGPGDPALAHQPDEHAPVEQMAEAARIYAAAGLVMLGRTSQ